MNQWMNDKWMNLQKKFRAAPLPGPSPPLAPRMRRWWTALRWPSRRGSFWPPSPPRDGALPRQYIFFSHKINTPLRLSVRESIRFGNAGFLWTAGQFGCTSLRVSFTLFFCVLSTFWVFALFFFFWDFKLWAYVFLTPVLPSPQGFFGVSDWLLGWPPPLPGKSGFLRQRRRENFLACFWYRES